MEKKKALLVYTSFSSFVKTDYVILSKRYNVTKYQFNNSKNVFKMVFEQIKLKIFLLLNIWKCDFVYCWFADYHSFLPILFGNMFRKKTFLVLGGYDVTYIPELKYGSFSNPIRSFCARNSMKLATLNLAVSRYVKKKALKIDSKINVKLCYIGVDQQNFYPSSSEKEKIILTVGNIDSQQRVKIKGIDFFYEVALKMPEYKFVIVGMNNRIKDCLQNIPDNLKIFHSIEHKDLIKYYQKAKVYCQFSIIESFCVALAEAMLCECIGVVTNVGALAEVIGEEGFIFENGDMESAEVMIRKAMNLNSEFGKKTSKRIKEEFSFDKRESELIELIQQ